MNDKIKELAIEADLLIKKSNGDEFRYGNFDPKLEKFAELIVRECAGLDFKSTGQVTTDGDIVISDFILEHFGIE